MSADRLGFTRPIFLDKLCDGVPDCPEGEDEGKITECNFDGEPTPNGCCAFPIIEEMGVTIKCVFTGNSNDSGQFSSNSVVAFGVALEFQFENKS